MSPVIKVLPLGVALDRLAALQRGFAGEAR
jgi:hypothetical protein